MVFFLQLCLTLFKKYHLSLPNYTSAFISSFNYLSKRPKYHVPAAVTLSGFSLSIEVAGGYYKIAGESGHSEKSSTLSFYRPMKFSQRILRSPMLNEHPALLSTCKYIKTCQNITKKTEDCSNIAADSVVPTESIHFIGLLEDLFI